MENKKSKGLGDSIAKVTKALGIDKVTHYVAKLAGVEGCGCDERKEYLNKLFPYDNSSRKFKVLKSFNHEGFDYNEGELIKVTKHDNMWQYVINYVRDGKLEEL